MTRAKKILIIGANGFIGSNAVHFFEHHDYEVWSCDRGEGNSEKFFHVGNGPEEFQNLFQEEKFEYCLNAAGSASVPFSLENPEIDFSNNTLLVQQILHAIRIKQPTCRFLNISSAAVYGNPSSLPISEEQPVKPLSPYGFHKRQAELLCEEYARFFQLMTCSIRVFSAYGPGQRKQLFWDLYRKAKGAKSIELFGTGNESRDYIYVTDLLLAAKAVFEKANFEGETINVANGEEILIKDAVSSFYNYLEWKGEVNFSGESRKGDPKNWRANITSLQKLGYERTVSFEKGLEKYVQWLKENE